MIHVGCQEVTDEDMARMKGVLESGLITNGPVLDEFEKKFAEYHKVNHALMMNSGTSALEACIMALKEQRHWKDGDQVMVPAMTFVASVNVILRAGLKPLFVDIHPHELTMDPLDMEPKLTEKTVCVMPVHLFGLLADMPKIMAFARENNLAVLEDSCECMGCFTEGGKDEYGNTSIRYCGSFGDAAAFSTYAAHIISTGVGGLATTNDPELFKIIQSYANHGRDPDFLGSRTPEVTPDMIDKRFRFLRQGHSFRATQMEAALGLSQIERLDRTLHERWKVALMLKDRLCRIREVQFQHWPPDRQHANMMFPIIAQTPVLCGKLVRTLEQNGVETRPLFPLLNQPVYDGMYKSPCPVAEDISGRGFYVGCHQKMTEADVNTIANIIQEVCNEQTRDQSGSGESGRELVGSSGGLQ